MFALEYERTAKSKELYAEVFKKFEAEQAFDRFLYLASNEDVLKFVSLAVQEQQAQHLLRTTVGLV